MLGRVDIVRMPNTTHPHTHADFTRAFGRETNMSHGVTQGVWIDNTMAFFFDRIVLIV